MAEQKAPGEHVLRDRIRNLEKRLAAVEKQLSRVPTSSSSITSTDEPAEAADTEQPEGQP